MNMDTKKSHSSNWLQENLGDMDKCTTRTLKLIEEAGDSISIKVELSDLVERSYEKYRSLAMHYDHVSRELKKSIPSDTRPREIYVEGSSYTSTTLDSDSESNNSSLTRNEEQNLPGEEHEMSKIYSKLAVYEQELRVAKENIRLSEEEIARLANELRKYESRGRVDSSSMLSGSTLKENTELTIQNLEEQLKSAQNEVSIWKSEVDSEKREVSKLQDRISRYKANLADREKEIRCLQDAISHADMSLSEENQQLRDDMARMAKEKMYLEDNLKELDLRRQCLEEEVRRLTEMKDDMAAQITEKENSINELKLTCEILNDKIDAEISSKDDHASRLSNCLCEMRARCDQLSTSAMDAQNLIDCLNARVKELEIEVERNEAEIVRGAEEKREAIRQLCFTLEYYWSGYHQLRRIGRKRRPAMMAR